MKTVFYHVTLAMCLLVPVASYSQEDSSTPAEVLTEEQMRRAYERAYQNFGAVVRGEVNQQDLPAVEQEVNILPDQAQRIYDVREYNDYLPLENLKINVGFNNTPIRDVLVQVMEQAAPAVGPWKVDWRLKEANRRILDERVKLNAETNFEDFIAYFTDRINNMTGVELFVSVFKNARTIVISDSF